MCIAESVDKFARFVASNLCDHHKEQRIRGDIKRNADEQVSATLVKLEGELIVYGVDVKLEKDMAGR
jgi:hypothetical protein